MDDLRSVLTRFEKKRVALAHFNVADLTLLTAVVAAAAKIEVPVLVGASERERNFFGTVEDSLAKKPNEVVPNKFLPFVVDSVEEVVSSRLRLFTTPAKEKQI
jgi:fructose/tagatose bisphosphate aldolase